MEVTYGLIANLVKTKSLERVLAPIASQISLLIILNESNGTSSSSKDEGRENQISQCALGLIKAVHRFIQVGQKQIQDSKDPVLQTQMKSACESLDLAGSDLKIASQKYQADVTNKQNGDRLIQAAKDVLHSMLKVLLVSDDSTVRKTLGLLESVQEKLSKVNSVQDKQQFLSAFKEFSEILIVLITMLKSRQSDLIRGPDREWLIREMNHLQKSIPSLSVSIQTYLKYINNPKAQVGKSSVVQEISSSLSKLHLFLENKPISDKSNDVAEDGHFVSRMSEVLEILKVEKRSEPLHDLEANLAVIVGHSMTVAHFCLDFHRNLIIRSSQRILQAKGRVLELQTLTKTNPNIIEIRRDFDGVCEMLMDELCDLEKHVNVSLLYLIIDVFKETNQPIDRLLKTALQADQVGYFIIKP
ncbi:hypothetical protein SNE40_008374 [Patella caerulea]|uniref:Uncharacterized protein n=1 Tax=Patella caerulea TaxID=87958 RepID=A0AAN8PWH8_PATCE